MATKKRKTSKRKAGTRRKGRRMSGTNDTLMDGVLVLAGAVTARIVEKKVLPMIIKSDSKIVSFLRPAIPAVLGYALADGMVMKGNNMAKMFGFGLMAGGGIGVAAQLLPKLGIGRTPFIAGISNGRRGIVQPETSGNRGGAPFIAGYNNMRARAASTAMFM